VCASFRPFVPSCTSNGRSDNTPGVNTLKVLHYPGPLPTSVSCARLFACVERAKVSNSSYSRDVSRIKRLFPAFSSLVHFEKKIRQYSSGIHTQDFASPGRLPTSVRCARLFACVERTKVSNSSYLRDPRMRLFPAFSSLVHFERKIKQFSRGKHTQGYASPWPIANLCQLHTSV
jgi:hypothetical protein